MTHPTAMKPTPRTSGAGASSRWALFALTLAYVFNLLDRSIIYILQEPIKLEFQLQDWQIGLLGGAAFGLFYSIMGLPIARLAERRNRTTLLKICIVVWSGMTALCGLATGYWMLLLTRVGVAVGESGGGPISHSLIGDFYPPERRATALAIYTMAVPFGLLAGSVVGGFVAQSVGWRWAFVAVGLPGLAVAVLVHHLIKEPERGRLDPAPAADAGPERPSLAAVFRKMAGDPVVLLVLAASSVAAFAAYGLTSFLAGWYLRAFALDLGTVGVIFGLIFGVSAAIGTYFGGALSDRFGVRDRRWYVLLPAACLTLAAPIYVLGFTQTSPWAAAAVMCAPGLLTTAHYGATFSTISNAFDARSRTTAVSIMFLAHSAIGGSLGPLFTGALSDIFKAQALDAGAAATCLADPGAPVCAAASASGLTGAMIVTALLFILAGALYALAAPVIARRQRAQEAFA